MGTEKRERQKAGRAARVEAAVSAQKRAEGRRRIAWIVGTLAFVAVALVVLALVQGGDDNENETASSSTSVSTSSSLAPVESAAGKPCVALADPLPAGAPEVPIVPGPPPTELQITDLTEGTGEPVPADATVTVDYIGVSCSTGKIFDASYGAQPATFPLSGVIPGWTEGIPGMKAGGKRLLVIPPEDGYGDSGAGSDIAPGETLWFVVEMRSFEAGTASSTTSIG
jgi:peptidylprolyl isomerase